MKTRHHHQVTHSVKPSKGVASMALPELPIILLVLVRIYCVFYSIIPDCDEVFNYYEPLNFLLRGFGKETWEYSPEYAIRSWAYLLPYVSFATPIAAINDKLDLFGPYVVFYFIRMLTASFTVYAEIHLYSSVKHHWNRHAAHWFLFLSTVAPGMSHASVALLPSSFAMSCLSLATSNLIKYFRFKNIRYALGVTFWFALGGLLGWPFVLVLAVISAIAISLHTIIIDRNRFVKYFCSSILILSFISSVIIFVDSVVYKKLEFVPLNIVLYNVINASEETGPNIFGVEPLSYYVYNLLLNFNIIAPLAYVGVVLLPFIGALDKSIAKFTILEVSTILSPLPVWTWILFQQPHKEERFLYPIYPIAILSAAFLLHNGFALLKCVLYIITGLKAFSRLLTFLSVFGFLLLVGLVSILRILSLSKNYGAPLTVYSHIPQTAQGNLCVGREWYRYPSSFFLPKEVRLRFVESGFRGLLPGDFNETGSLIDSISSIPPNMNNLNKFDESKLWNFDACDFFVDTNQAIDNESNEIEIINSNNEILQGWKLITSVPFLNNDESEGIGRLIYIPKSFLVKLETKMVYRRYNLYERIQ